MSHYWLILAEYFHTKNIQCSRTSIQSMEARRGKTGKDLRPYSSAVRVVEGTRDREKQLACRTYEMTRLHQLLQCCQCRERFLFEACQTSVACKKKRNELHELADQCTNIIYKATDVRLGLLPLERRALLYSSMGSEGRHAHGFPWHRSLLCNSSCTCCK